MLLINGRILPMDGPEIPNGYVRVREGRIEAVGPMEECGRGEEEVDLGGRLVTPGFVDAHSHIGLYEDGLGFEGDDLNEDTDPCTPHVRALDGVNPLDRCFREAVDSGVTCAVVSPGSANPIGGQIFAMKTWGRLIDAMALREPLAIKLAFGENIKQTYSHKNQGPVTRMAAAAIIREQLYKTRRYLEDKEAAEEDSDLAPPDWDMKCEALVPLLKGEIRAHIHAHRAYDILTGIRIAREFGFPYTLIHCTEGHLIAQELGELGVAAVCGPMPGTRTKPELSNMSLDNPAKLAEAGALVAISTDHPEVGVDFLAASAAVAAANGLDREEALRAITINAARAVSLEDRVGSLTPGKDADLLVFGEDPLGTCAKPEMVFIGGKRIK